MLSFLNRTDSHHSEEVSEKVVSDQGSQLTSKENSVATGKLEWTMVKAMGARGGTEWKFVPVGAQFRNGLAESQVKVIKHMFEHILLVSLLGRKHTLNYAELCT